MSDQKSPILLPSHSEPSDDHKIHQSSDSVPPAPHSAVNHVVAHHDTSTSAHQGSPVSESYIPPVNNQIPKHHENPNNNASKSFTSNFSPKGKSPVMMFIIAQILVIAIGVSGYFGYQKFFATKPIEESSTSPSPDDDKKNILATLSKYIDLPSDEPVIMTISDIEKLKDNPFFTRAQNNDKVIVFKESKRALLYRPSTNKLIDMQTVALDENPQEGKPDSSGKVAGTSDTSTPLKVAILNGTTTAGLATKSKIKLTESVKSGQVEVVHLGNAANRSYTQGVIYDATGKLDGVVAEISKIFGAKATKTLPAGETLPSGSQILIIVTQ